jgi:hypothetical protein
MRCLLAGEVDAVGPSTSAAASAAPSSEAAAGINTAQAGGSNGLPVMLSRSRRADVSEYRGKTFVNVREYYEVRTPP